MGHRPLLLSAALAACGCGRVMYFNAVGDGHDGGAVDGGPAGDGSSGAPDAGQADVGAVDAVVDPSCGSPRAPFASLRRLRRFEYDNTLRDLLGDLVHPSAVLPPYADNDAEVTGVSAVLVDGVHAIAHEVAVKIGRDPSAVRKLTGCDAAARGEDACRAKFLREFVGRAFRRPATPDDLSDLEQVFAGGRQLGGDFASGVRAVLEVVLQSPEFLYRVELGEPAGAATPDLARPSPDEMATRLSYLLWGSTPDEALLDAARQGALRTKEEVMSQARRLLADPRAHDVVRHFYLQLYGLSEVDFLERELNLHPRFTPELPDLLRQETERFIDDVVWQGPGTFEALLTAPSTWLNGPLAAFYGVGGVSGDAFRRVDVDAARRGGLFTQGTFLASTSRNTWTNPVLRGRMILGQILCVEPPPPPDDIPVLPPPPSSDATTRQRLEQVVNSGPGCISCHRLIDPLGFAFEHYDALGLWRDLENGHPIDATGEIYETDAKGKFDGAIELMQLLVHSRDAQHCHVGKWLAFAYGRQEKPEDACSRRTLEETFARTNGNVKELLLALTQTDGFLYRRTRE